MMTFGDLPEPFRGIFESDKDYVPELVLNFQVRSRGFWIISRYLSSWSARNLPISELRFFFLFQNRKNVTSNHNHHNNSWIVILFKQNVFIINQFEIMNCFFFSADRVWPHRPDQPDPVRSCPFWVLDQKITFGNLSLSWSKTNWLFWKNQIHAKLIFFLNHYCCLVHTVSLSFRLGLGTGLVRGDVWDRFWLCRNQSNFWHEIWPLKWL